MTTHRPSNKQRLAIAVEALRTIAIAEPYVDSKCLRAREALTAMGLEY